MPVTEVIGVQHHQTTPTTPLGDGRGIIVPPNVRLESGKLAIRSIDAIEPAIRRALLYWDRICVPDSNAIKFGLTPEMQKLKAAGVLSQMEIKFSNVLDFQAGAIGTRFVAFDELNKADRGNWSLLQEGTEFALVPAEHLIEMRSVQLRLYNLLPVARNAVPFEDVLAFKEKRSDELAALRVEMDSLYQTIIAARDQEQAFRSAEARIRKTVADLSKAMNESFPTRVLGVVKVDISVDTFTNGLAAAAAAWTAHAGGVCAVGVGLGATVLSAFRLERGSDHGPRSVAKHGPFAYALSVMQEGWSSAKPHR